MNTGAPDRDAIRIKISRETIGEIWDDYVLSSPHACAYHLQAWNRAIEGAYRHQTYYMMATRGPSIESRHGDLETHVTGILPLVLMKTLLGGNCLISLPFCDSGGILSKDRQTEGALLSSAVKMARGLGVKTIELRHGKSLSLSEDDLITSMNGEGAIRVNSVRHKFKMTLNLPSSSDALFASFRSKLRSQIRKPQKEGLNTKIGGMELLDDFYHVFSINMRDLGSPVHGKSLFRNVLLEHGERAKILIIHRDNDLMACGLIIGFRDVVENPWASSIRDFSRLAPNMLLYWAMLKYACDNGYRYFDFGRSAPSDGTYKFKEQWGAKPQPLSWQFISLNGNGVAMATDKSKFETAMRCWRKLPVPLTKVIGPVIRKRIGL